MKHFSKKGLLFIIIGMLSLFCSCKQDGSAVYEDDDPAQILSMITTKLMITTKPMVTLEPPVTVTPEPTATPELTGTPVPTATSTPTPEPVETPVPPETNTPTPKPAETPVPTATSTPSPEPTKTPAPTATSMPTSEPTLIIPKTSAATTGALASMNFGKTKEDFHINDFFVDSVFSGDSVMSHFYWMVPYYDEETFGGCYFLGKSGYSVREALKLNSEIHPMYQGEQRQIWESMKLIEPAPKRIFLFFGFNDIGIDGMKGFMNNYDKLIGHIKEAVPDIKVYIIGLTPMRADMEGRVLNNSIIREANGLLQEYCLENNFGYIDVASDLTDEGGALNTKYSDGTNVHLTKSAYLLWKDALVEYGKEVLLIEYNEAMAEVEKKNISTH